VRDVTMKDIKPLEELLDSVRNIEGFPIGKDEDILALSEPPYYTACPNPYINDFIKENGKPYVEETDDYHREPFVSDVSEGKNDPIYMAHQYPTKVPYKAIVNFIKHYTNRDDIVYDGFCGTGMTGIASQLINRKCILSDISPYATFIAKNFNIPNNLMLFKSEILKIKAVIEDELSWMYETIHVDEKFLVENNYKGKINYIVWSDVFVCSHCDVEHVFWDNALDIENKKLKELYHCPNCNALVSKKNLKKASIKLFDNLLRKEVVKTKQVPVLIIYTYNNKRFEKKPDEFDLELIKRIDKSTIPYWVPINKILNKGDKWGDTWRAGVHLGISYVHHFYTKRNFWALASFYNISRKSMCKAMNFIFSSMILRSTQMNRVSIRNFFHGGGGWNLSPLTGTLYYPSLSIETSILAQITSRIGLISRAIQSSTNRNYNKFVISTESVTNSTLPKNSIDYIFTDPPFGDNLMYSELNFIPEAWLKVFTNNKSEAIVNNSQNKKLSAYQESMQNAFIQYYRVLKPNRWITVVFHNSKSSVWNAIQEAMSKAGFVIANVSVLDKKQGSFKQVTSAGAVKNDLVISAYKPIQNFERKFLEFAGSGLEKEFIRMHLSHLPAELTIERTEQMLYSKMLAYYVQRSYTIKYDSHQFYKMLRDHFTQEDGYWFNNDQIAAYHEYKKEMKLEEIEDIKTGQSFLFVTDEKSALIWLHAFLDEPKDFKTIHPTFTKVANISDDQMPDLHEILENNFIFESDSYRRPQTDDEKLNVSQKRERELLREFDALFLEAKGSKRKIKECTIGQITGINWLGLLMSLLITQ